MPPSRRPTGFRDDERSVSGVLGYVLVLFIVFAGIVIVLSIGLSGLDFTRGQSEIIRAEHSMTLFDSRAAMVALGTSSSQKVSFGQDSGSFVARNRTGYISLHHHNYTKYNHGKTEELYNSSLGSFVYNNDGTEIAYQGGGVWRLPDTGDATMISPPEFHYRDATLTLPIIRIADNASASGSSRVVMSRDSGSVPVFPNRTSTATNGTGAPYDHDERDYLNPVENGTLYTKIHSEYYEGWATYFRERTTGDVTVWDKNETVRLDLLSLGGEPGVFEMPTEQDDGGGSQPVQALGEEHPISTFELELQAPDTGNNNFQSMEWSLYSSNDNGDELEIHLSSGGKCNGNPSSWSGNEIDLSLHYYNDTNDEAQQWREGFDPSKESVSVMDIDCSADPGVLTVNLTDDSDTLGYTDITSSSQWHFSPGDHTPPADIEPDQHDSYDGETYDRGSDSETVNWTVNHYMTRLGTDFELKVDDGPGEGEGSGRVDEDNSLGELRYQESESSEYIAYLHVTETKLDIAFQ